ncbi:MAG TPA: T9SS type A sorting domain-containing protein [Bacteroidales bacterium]|jgi:hypothetical protein|nr:T9SS type A sorting domain-containing protein [Bacteroidales bacterium]HPT15270.1 T9SS type A sorting domain-containing protein [Bacteroidales bacterium]
MKKVSFQKTNRWLLALLIFSGISAATNAQVQNLETTVSDTASSAIGYQTKALSNYSFAAGKGSDATGIAAVALGYEVQATGKYSFASGYQSFATGNTSTAIGYNCIAEGIRAVALGQNCASNNQGFSFGQSAKALGQQSLAIGRFVETDQYLGMNSIVIGSCNDACVLKNDIGSSLMIGFNSTKPTIFVSKSEFTPYFEGIGKVGIGTTSPVARFQVADGDIFIQDIDRGIIMKSPDGSCWRGTLNNSGQLEFVKLPDCENFTGIKTNEAQDSGTVKVFPNPSNGYIDVKCSSSDCLKYNSLSLYTSDGHLVFTQPFSGESARISTNSLQAGTYVIKLSGRQNSYSDIIVVSH